MLLTAGGWSPGMLLNIPEPSLPPQQSVSSEEAEKPRCGQKANVTCVTLNSFVPSQFTSLHSPHEIARQKGPQEGCWVETTCATLKQVKGASEAECNNIP